MKRLHTAIPVLCLALALGLLALSCAPTAAPAPKPTPAPGKPTVPQSPATPAAPAPAKPRATVNVATPWGTAAGSQSLMGVVMSKLLHDHSPWLRSTPVIVEGSNKGIELWQKNKDQGVFVLAFNVATMGEYVQGIKTFKEQGPRKDQGLLCLTTMLRNFWLSKATSGVSTPADLKGKKMALGMPGTNSLINAQDTLQLGLGLKPGTDYFPKYVGIDDIVGLLKEGTVDAVSWGEMSVRGIPYAYVDDLANYTKLNFISFKQEHIDKINKGAGMDVYVLDKVVAGTYKNQSADVFWVTSPSFSTLPLMYSEDVAYEWCRVWWSFWDEGTEISKLFGLGAPEMTREALKQKWPFTWHPGALKYYKEKGWI